MKTSRFNLDAYYRSEAWKKKAGEAKERVGKCQLCASTTRLEVHHNTYDRVGKEGPYDLVVLCHECHRKYHGHMNEDDLMWGEGI